MGSQAAPDMEDLAGGGMPRPGLPRVTVAGKRKRGTDEPRVEDNRLAKTWREELGNPPTMGKTRVRFEVYCVNVV